MPRIRPDRVLTRLADGRELVYYDDRGTARAAAPAPDRRDLPPRPQTPRMRQDPLSGEWISHATARQGRVVLPPAESDPLAPQSSGNDSEIPSSYDVAVFENRSPSFGPALPGPGDLLELEGVGIGRSAPSYGRCEVVCFSPEHEGSLGGLAVERVRTVIDAWADRTAALSVLPGIAQVFPFENRGAAVGVTLPHPHGQIYGYPYVTPRTARLLAMIEQYDGDLQAELLAFERAGERVVVAGERWTAFVPYAARWPVEVHLMPHRQVPDLAGTTEEERAELADLYPRLLRAVDRLYDDATPYIAAWHQAPVHSHRDIARLTLQLTSPRRGADKLKFLAGSEAAMGAWVADVGPEEQAARLRAALEEDRHARA
ncbi:MAG: galactose-1-phosphate uridylyltransferase [Nocardioidaceae bacterium]|nr:galactose-1-phosphate uridylyltransferase [Nocardioidaceae bacterium]MCL2613587.1 galactose-1-phosphate uridylyltransferase [Nocardioidaceae bacterium]